MTKEQAVSTEFKLYRELSVFRIEQGLSSYYVDAMEGACGNRFNKNTKKMKKSRDRSKEQ